MLGALNQLETATDKDKEQHAERLYDLFKEAEDVLACYMNHDDVDAAKNAVVCLRSAVHHHDEDDILSAAETVRAQLDKLRNIDAIRLENVL